MSNMNGVFERFSKVLEKIIFGIIAVMMATLCLVVFSSVMSRYFFNLSIAWSEEAS
jgi:TRAP-type C4-dicarboxylate transport system permease small subunit